MLSQTKIALIGINSTYQHTSIGLLYLKANLGPYSDDSKILEFTTDRPISDVLRRISDLNPEIIGIGVYIWNRDYVLKLCRQIKLQNWNCRVVLGGPEVSFSDSMDPLIEVADLVICGEGEDQFREVCENYLQQNDWPMRKVIPQRLPEIKNLRMPYHLYSDADIENRYLYVEASRGCPYKCEYCLSSLDEKVRTFDLELFLKSIDELIARGARNFKFIDRTFNLKIETCRTILNFFVERLQYEIFLHFEMVPDRLPEELFPLLQKFPPGRIQFEVGIQTMNPTVARLVSRRTNLEAAEKNIRALIEKTHVHIHADLIFGLPGESLQSFAKGFNELLKWGPHEIQVGQLKKLKGTPIARHDVDYKMKYNEEPPFEIQSTKDLSSFEVLELNLFAKYWDLISNQGRFPELLAALKFETEKRNSDVFSEFMKLSKFIWQQEKTSVGLPPKRLRSHLEDFLFNEFSWKSHLPKNTGDTNPKRIPKTEKSLIQRQSRHVTSS